MNGFTLLDSLFTLALLALMAMLGIGSLNQSLSQHKAHTVIQQLVSDLEFARQQALLLNTSVKICPSKKGENCNSLDDWKTGYLIVGQKNWIHRQMNTKDTLENSREYIEFSPKGTSENTNSTFIYTTPYRQHKVIINRQGRIRVE